MPKISYDFDQSTQRIFDQKFSNLKPVDWKEWPYIFSSEEYEELAFKLSGLTSFDDIWNKFKYEEANSKELTINLESYIKAQNDSPLIICHTSGTTNSDLNSLKWFHMSNDLVKRLWAPGMQAIFQSSGLGNQNSALIFVPSRLKFDGLNKIEDKKYISLYSPEFSQRVMLSVIKPKSYLLYEYKDVFNLSVLNKILNMDKIAVLSAPAATILKWADRVRLSKGIEFYLKNFKDFNESTNLNKYVKEVKTLGLEKFTNELHKKLSLKLKDAATLVFSISSLNYESWNLIRDFLGWEKGKEKFTSLYVGSEIGPFASNLSLTDFNGIQKDEMFVFPLTLPVIEYKGQKNFITKTNYDKGKLFVSYQKEGKPIFNIDVGDFIYIKSKEGLPRISGTILRNGFEIKYPTKIAQKVDLPPNKKMFAGDYFNFNKFEIIEPRNLLNCLRRYCNYQYDTILFVSRDSEMNWDLYLEKSCQIQGIKENQLMDLLQNCDINPSFKKYLTSKVNLHLIDDELVSFVRNRSEMLEKVRNGNVPKGVLKKWPIYIIK
ncbi:MAG: hypothetical protein P8Y70_17265 [Candidatus Lokiarchaeota archaeon]